LRKINSVWGHIPDVEEDNDVAGGREANDNDEGHFALFNG
jgi:hypothetical protein